MQSLSDRLNGIEVFGVDIDGTLTDGTLSWAGDDWGWTQRFTVRDGEAILRLVARGIPVVPISRNRTRCARARMQGLQLPLDWVGIADKLVALSEVSARYRVAPAAIAYIGDGREDAAVFAQVGLGACVQDGHGLARAQAHLVTAARGGAGAVEELIDRLFAARGWTD